MITVHHLEMSRSQRILWLLEELGVPYDIRLYRRDPASRLAPVELKRIHPLGKSPVVTDGDTVVAESGAIIEYLAERFGAQAPAELAHLEPARGTAEHRQCRFWMHYAEGSLMNWLVMKLVFDSIPRQPMPFLVRPVARALCAKVQQKLITPNRGHPRGGYRGTPGAAPLVCGRAPHHGGLSDELCRGGSPGPGRQRSGLAASGRLPPAPAGTACLPACAAKGRAGVDVLVNGP